MTCDCQSYNRPDVGGTTPEIVLSLPAHMVNEGRETICVDACMADVIEALWAEGIETQSCCCGHNGAFGPPAVVVHARHAKRARTIAPPHVEIKCWRLVTQEEKE